MAFSTHLQQFRHTVRIVLNDRFMGDEGAKQLSCFLSQHKKVQALQLKSNDITSEGFLLIFQALNKNLQLRQLIIEYNSLGQQQYNDWQTSLSNLIINCTKLERLDISNNKISAQAFAKLIPAIAISKSLKLLELRYNSISSDQVQQLIQQLKSTQNSTLLYVELSGNKIRKENLDSLQNLLKVNRSKNPIAKSKFLMTKNVSDNNETSMINNSNTGYLNRTNAIDGLSKENILRHLQDILDQNRKDTAEMKIRLERELQQLQKRQKNDARQLNDLDKKCNELVIQNRNLKFQLDRTVGEHQQMQRDQQHQLRLHEQKLRQANKELQSLEHKYQDIEQRMSKQHEMKMKQISREWQNRLRSLEQKIRSSENENNVLQNEIKKNMEKRQRMKMEYMQEQTIIRNKVHEQQSQNYGIKLGNLQSKFREIEESREKLIRRNQDLVYEIEKTESNNNNQIVQLDEELNNLKLKEQQFVEKNRDFLNRNQNLKSEIKMKQISIQKLQQEVNKLNEQIELKKSYNHQQIDKIIHDEDYNRSQKQQEKKAQINKISQLENQLRKSQMENAKLRQQYAILAQKLQVSLGQAVQEVFTENSLY